MIGLDSAAVMRSITGICSEKFNHLAWTSFASWGEYLESKQISTNILQHRQSDMARQTNICLSVV